MTNIKISVSVNSCSHVSIITRTLEENLIKEILRQSLGREPVLEDVKNLHKHQQESKSKKYYLTYKNLKLGTIYKNYNSKGGKVVVKFISFETRGF